LEIDPASRKQELIAKREHTRLERSAIDHENRDQREIQYIDHAKKEREVVNSHYF
jgi:hypothetical protein